MKPMVLWTLLIKRKLQNNSTDICSVVVSVVSYPSSRRTVGLVLGLEYCKNKETRSVPLFIIYSINLVIILL